MMLSLCYDQVVFIDKTTALAPVSQKAKGGGGGGMSGLTVASSKRLLKEYQRLLRKPPPGIEAHPLESNILEWHFLIKPDQPPYVGGEYHGSLEFPMECVRAKERTAERKSRGGRAIANRPLTCSFARRYPMKPPAFRVFTPSGRFEPGVRLCMSMSDYHPESWNPSWCVNLTRGGQGGTSLNLT
jgi:ubiquitin-conjugating enzyme E2 J2